MTSKTDPDPDGEGSLSSPVTAYVYDADSQVTGVTDPRGNTTNYAYDNDGRLSTVTQPDPDGAGSLPLRKVSGCASRSLRIVANESFVQGKT